MTVQIILLSSILAMPTLSLDQDLSGLKLVHLLYRHGDRTPINPFPSDPYKDLSNWPVGFGQLTSRGMMQQFELGQWIRDRYDGFLSNNYSQEEIVVRSTDVDRTIMSAQANLAGLYPPSGYWKWNTDLPWQPIPVHTVPQVEDSLLSSHADCPRYEQLQKEIKSSKFMTDIYNENRELFEYISANAGINITDIVKLDYIFDTLLIENIYGMELPEWTKKVFPGGKFEELRDLSFTVNTLNHELKRLKGGPFVAELVRHFDSVAADTLSPPNRKVFMYSGHDTTVAPVLHTLGVFNMIAPPYASMVLVELFDREGLVVRVSYKNESSHQPYVFTLPGCHQFCPLQQFKDLTANICPDDWRMECGFPTEDLTVQKVTLVAAIASSIMAFTVLVATLANIFCRKKERGSAVSARYQRIQQVEAE
eukprot:GFUD01030110.1.p1 GENE.GFUD01030110.1~~GFUD01030110.1.p1  ORF type:complete len:422 (+),score=142.80 GFUD01030110.1:64-1329(+)